MRISKPSRIQLAVVCFAIATGCGRSDEQALRAQLPLLAFVEAAATRRLGEPSIAPQRGVTRRVAWDRRSAFTSAAPDGKLIAGIDWDTGDLFVFDPDRGETRLLTHQSAPYEDGSAFAAVFSRDGERIAYSWTSWGDSPAEDGLRVVATRGGSPRVVRRQLIDPADWSPDGSRILGFHARDDGMTEIVIVNVEDGASHVLRTLDWREPGILRYSPDARYIAYDYPADDKSEQHDIYLLAADGSGAGKLIEHPAHDRFIDWSPAGDAILFFSDRSGTPGAWQLPLSATRPTGAPELVKADLWNASPVGGTRNGHFFYNVEIPSRNIYTATLSAQGKTLASPGIPVATRGAGTEKSPDWSPDGRHIAFHRSGSTGAMPQGIVIRAIETGTEREVQADRPLDYVFRLRWMPDGRALLVLANNERRQRELIRLDAQTGITESVLRDGDNDVILQSGYEVSPDGRTLYYARRASPSEVKRSIDRIIARDLVTGSERMLYRGKPGEFVRFADLSRDGATIALLEKRGSRDTVILLSTRDASVRTMLLPTQSTPIVNFTADGQALYAWHGGERVSASGERVTQLWRIDIGNGRATSLGPVLRSANGYDGYRVHPDGRSVAFSSGTSMYELWTLDPRAAVRGRIP